MKKTIPNFYVSRHFKHGYDSIKNVFNVLLVSILSFSAFAQIPTGNLFLRYDFEGNINDAVGGTATFTYGTPTYAADRFSSANSAIVLNGTDQYFRSDNEVTFTPDFTVSFWLKTTSSVGGVLFTRGDQQGGGSHDRKFVLKDDGKVAFGVFDGGGVVVESSITSVNDGNWHHLVATHAAASGFKLYIDGVQEATSTAISGDGANGYLVVGNGDSWGNSTNSYFEGQLDELLFYTDKALSAVEVSSIFNYNPSTFISTNQLNFDVAGSKSVLTVTSTIGLEVATPSHITASPVSINIGVTVVTFTASVFNNSIPVSSEISISGTNYSALISASYNIVFSSNPAMLAFPVAGGPQLVTVTSNVPMNAVGDANASVLPSSILSGVSVITVTALTNTKYATVYGQINFNAGNTSKKIDYTLDQFTGNIPNDLLVYEPFDYEEGKVVLSKIAGGIGFTGNISLGDNGGSNSNANKFSIKNSPVLDYAGLASRGNYFVGGQSNEGGLPVVRSIDLNDPKIASFINTDNTIGKSGKTLYTGFVLAKTAPYENHEVTLSLFNGTDPFNNSGKKLVEFGYFVNSSSVFGGPYPIQIRAGSSNSYTGNVVAISGNTANLLVLKIEFGTTEHTFTGYVNPTVDGIEPSTPAIGPVLFSGFDANTSGFSNLAWSTGNDANGDASFEGSGAIDEIRIATTYLAAVPGVKVAINPVGNITTILGNGSTVQFKSMITSANAGNVSWSSVSIPDGNASIDPTSGLLTVGGNQSGTVTITGSISLPIALSSNYVLTIIPAAVTATGLAITGATSGNVNISESTVLSVTYAPLATNQFGVNWSSSNAAVASVTNGTLSGIALGTVTITATYGLNSAVKATKVITVIVPVTGVSVSGVSSIIKGNTATLTGTVSPSSPSDGSLTWSTSNSSFATVNSAGVVSAINLGIVTITATSVSNPSVKGTLVIQILPIDVTSIIISGPTSVLGLGTATLFAAVLPANASYQAVKWSSSNTAIATVSGSGVVRGLSLGTVTITATSISTTGISGMYEVAFKANSVTIVPSIVLIAPANKINTPNGTLQITASVTGSSSSVVYSVSDNSIASINTVSGLLTALADGTVIVTGKLSTNTTIIGSLTISITSQTLATQSGIEQLVSVYPNPTLGLFFISVNGVANVDIFDLQGKLIESSVITGTTSFNSSSFSKGIYVVSVTKGGDVFMKKLVIE